MKQGLSIHGNGVTSTFESDIGSIESIQPFAAKYRFNQYQTQGFCDIVRSIHRLILCVIVTDTTQRVITETIRHVGLPRLLCFIAKLGTVGDYIYIDKSRGLILSLMSQIADKSCQVNRSTPRTDRWPIWNY